MADANNAGDNLSTNARDDVNLKPYRELTWEAVTLGVIQGIVLNLAFCYAALKLGFSLGGSTVAAIMGYALLRGVLRKGTMVENNINQTIASGINTAGTGVIFTVPALFLLNQKWQQDGTGSLAFEALPLAIAGIAGAILGVVVIIPLRKQMIEMDRLRFPTGVAVTTIIRAGSTGVEKAKLLAIGFAIAAVWKMLMLSGWLDSTSEEIAASGFGITHEELYFGGGVIPAQFAPVIYLSLMNLAAGMLAGRGGLPFFAGGILSWWVIAPAAASMDWVSPELIESFGGIDGAIYSKMFRPLGIGTLVGGALMGVVMAFPAIQSAMRSLATAARNGWFWQQRWRRRAFAEDVDLRNGPGSRPVLCRFDSDRRSHDSSGVNFVSGRNGLAGAGGADRGSSDRHDRHLADVRHGSDFSHADDGSVERKHRGFDGRGSRRLRSDRPGR
jgi:putative OPT family oligopeptide transporter